MLKNIALGQYFPIDSIIHRLDPRIKILITFIYIISLFLIDKFIVYTAIILFLLIIVILSKLHLRMILKSLKPLYILILITFLINLLTIKGEILYKIGPLSISNEGISHAFFMAFRLVFLITGTSLLTLTTSPISLTDGIEKLLNPFKKVGVPAHELAMMMTIALRFIPTLMDETDKIIKAQKARGANFESGNLISRAKNLIPILVPLFISSFRRADELALAMEARCYRGGSNRTRMKVLKIEFRDYIAIGISIILMSVVISSKFF